MPFPFKKLLLLNRWRSSLYFSSGVHCGSPTSGVAAAAFPLRKKRGSFVFAFPHCVVPAVFFMYFPSVAGSTAPTYHAAQFVAQLLF